MASSPSKRNKTNCANHASNDPQPISPIFPQPRYADTDPAALLRRLGWHPSDWKQIEAYALMPPARKVEQMLRLRHKHVGALKKRLRREHPNCTEKELAHLVQEHLEMLKGGPLGEW